MNLLNLERDTHSAL